MQPTHHTPSSQRGFVGDFSTSALPALPTDILASALDELACGVMVVDQDAKVLHYNAAARSVLLRGDCVEIRNHRIVTAHTTDTRSLQDAILKATQGKRSMIALGALSRTTVAVVPLQHPDKTGNLPAKDTPPLRFALMFSRAGVCEALMLSFFSRAHSLTAAEENVLGLMCAGLTAPEMAQRLKVGEATIRTHVRNICAKTHSSGIREVVKRLAVLPPLMAAVMPSAFA